MGIMTSENRDSVNVRVVNDLFIIRGGILKAKLFSGMLCVESAGGCNTYELNVTGFLDGGKQNGIGKRAGSQDAEHYRTCFCAFRKWKVDCSTLYFPLTAFRICK